MSLNEYTKKILLDVDEQKRHLENGLNTAKRIHRNERFNEIMQNVNVSKDPIDKMHIHLVVEKQFEKIEKEIKEEIRKKEELLKLEYNHFYNKNKTETKVSNNFNMKISPVKGYGQVKHAENSLHKDKLYFSNKTRSQGLKHNLNSKEIRGKNKLEKGPKVKPIKVKIPQFERLLLRESEFSKPGKSMSSYKNTMPLITKNKFVNFHSPEKSFKFVKYKDNASSFPNESSNSISEVDSSQKGKSVINYVISSCIKKKSLTDLSFHILPGFDIRPALCYDNLGVINIECENFPRLPNKKIGYTSFIFDESDNELAENEKACSLVDHVIQDDKDSKESSYIKGTIRNIEKISSSNQSLLKDPTKENETSKDVIELQTNKNTGKMNKFLFYQMEESLKDIIKLALEEDRMQEEEKLHPKVNKLDIDSNIISENINESSNVVQDLSSNNIKFNLEELNGNHNSNRGNVTRKSIVEEASDQLESQKLENSPSMQNTDNFQSLASEFNYDDSFENSYLAQLSDKAEEKSSFLTHYTCCEDISNKVDPTNIFANDKKVTSDGQNINHEYKKQVDNMNAIIDEQQNIPLSSNIIVAEFIDDKSNEEGKVVNDNIEQSESLSSISTLKNEIIGSVNHLNESENKEKSLNDNNVKQDPNDLSVSVVITNDSAVSEGQALLRLHSEGENIDSMQDDLISYTEQSEEINSRFNDVDNSLGQISLDSSHSQGEIFMEKCLASDKMHG